ncbi:hypothetical protein [Olsenella uli]|uniref:hypothetical protein n=1 Tax=Olsenella uli TaxID=133926 RepID=UPI0024A8B2A7|nr:hypothetical protein [Olsenella uli]
MSQADDQVKSLERRRRRESGVAHQCAGVQPVELPAAQAEAAIARLEPTPTKRGSEKFGLGRWA